MKKVLLLVTVITANAFAAERKELMPLIEAAVAAQSNAYIEARERITAFDETAIPILGMIAKDNSLPWQQRLVARICYERMDRKGDIEKLLAMDWYRHPNFDPKWKEFITGPELFMGKMVVPELKAAGLWYYCLELVWKMTDEKPKLWADRGKNRYHWIHWCVTAVKDNPEERIWFLRVCADVLETAPPHPLADWLRPVLSNEKTPDVVPLLFRYCINKDTEIGPWFYDILKYADTRSLDVLEAYISTKPNSDYHNGAFRLVRERPVPPAPEPPFRLGTVKTSGRSRVEIKNALFDTSFNIQLTALAISGGTNYLDWRNTFLASKNRVLPKLKRVALDETQPWSLRLTARICYERITRGEDIQALLQTDWKKLGVSDALSEEEVAQIVLPVLRKFGLWHYCLEQEWKEANEIPPETGLAVLDKNWGRWCTQLVDGESERYWLHHICADVLTRRPGTVGGYPSLWYMDKGVADDYFFPYSIPPEGGLVEFYIPDGITIGQILNTQDDARRKEKENPLLYERRVYAQRAVKEIRERMEKILQSFSPDSDTQTPSFRLGMNIIQN